MKHTIMAILIASFSACVVSSAGEKQLTGDMRALQGKWRVRFAKNDSIIIEIKNDTLMMTRHGPTEVSEPAKGSFTIDEKPSPKHMTWMNVKGSVNLEINRCIYELHGDTWLLIGGFKDRPEHFFSADGDSKTWILKREK